MKAADTVLNSAVKLPRKKLPKRLVGWKEPIQLPRLGNWVINAKIDTGARTCSLHVDHLEIIDLDGIKTARFKLKRIIGAKGQTFAIPVVEFRNVKSSSGHVENRVVIKTDVYLAGKSHRVAITLTDRNDMQFPMLIGRNLLKRSYIVDVSAANLSQTL